MAVLTFVAYGIVDDGVVLRFADADGAYKIHVTNAELATITTQPALRTLVITKLQRKVLGVGIKAKLDPLLNQTVTI